MVAGDDASPGRAIAAPSRPARGVLWAVAAVVCLFTFVGWRQASLEVANRLRSQFDRQVQLNTFELREHIVAYEMVVRAGAAFLDRTEGVDHPQWSRFVADLQLATWYPGIQALEWVERVPAEGLDGHLRNVRRQGFPTYAVYPPGAREEYFPVTLVEPGPSNQTVLGFDLFSEPRRRAAGERARDTGRVAITSRIQLIQDAAEVPTAGLLMFLPAYRELPAEPSIAQRRAALRGFVVAKFRMDDLITRGMPSRRHGVELAIFDDDPVAAGIPLYPSTTDSRASAYVGLESQVPVEIGGHTWTLHFRSAPGFVAGLDAGAPYRTLFYGSGIGGLLCLLMLILRRSEQHALVLATEMTTRAAEGEQRLRTIVDAEPECVEIVGVDGTLLEINPAGLAMVEAEHPEQVVGRSAFDLIHPDDRDLYREWHDRAAAGKSVSFAFRIVGLRGGLHWMESSLVPLREGGRITSVLSVTRDVTEGRRVEDALRAREQQYREIVETADEGIWTIDGEDRTTFVNGRMAQLLGYEVSEMVGRPFLDFLFEEEQQASIHGAAERRSVGIGGEYPFRFRRRNGAPLHTRVSTKPLLSADGRYAGALAMVTDVTARREVEEAFRESQSLVSSIVEHSPSVVFVKDATSLRYVLVNRAAVDLAGYSREEFLGKTDTDIFPPELAASFIAADRDVLTRGQPLDVPEEVVQTKDGRLRLLHTVKVPIVGEDGRPRYLLGITEDITDRARTEIQLRQAQKMEALGTLAGGIAHDFNNILTSIIGFAELAWHSGNGDALEKTRLANILEAGRRARGLVQQITAFSRQQDIEREPLDPGRVVREAITLMRAGLPSSVTIRTDLADALPPVFGDATQLHQIVMNLANNAAQAMKQNGLLELILDHVTIAPESPERPVDLQPGDYVRLVVRDSGTGMDAATRERMFDPFFTTKGRGEGTGLGLAVVHGIVKLHGGAIAVESELGRGTTITVFLPAWEGEPPSAPPEETPVPHGEGEHVLFVDDERPLAELGRIQLETLGYRVTALTDPDEALAVFRAGPGAFDIVVTDLTMPHLSGTALAVELLRIRPDLPILLYTGYGGPLTSDEVRGLGLRGLLPKPHTLASLGRAVRGALIPA